MYIEIMLNGSKHWRLKYWCRGKKKLIAPGMGADNLTARDQISLKLNSH
ncbi:hypothetical protein [Paraburkholderia sp. J12]|nr:hypothetical protein [Paraburkholderia sp. J12]